MQKKIEHRTIKCDFRVDSKTGKPTIYGYAAKYNVRSSDLGGWTEVIAPSAFTNNLKTNPDVRALFNHDQNLVLGRTASGTMRLKSDGIGLAYEVDPPDTQAARDLVTLMQRGDVNQSSFGFVCNDATWSVDPVTNMDVRTVTDAELFDCSPVTYPAYPQATSGVRSFPADMPMGVRSRLAKRDGDAGDPNDCQCLCADCRDGNCDDCSDNDCDDPNCVCADITGDADGDEMDGADDADVANSDDIPEFNSKSRKRSVRRKTHTKSVDGENLTADDFLIVGDPTKTDTWNLPWKFSTEEKTVSHLRDALSRFDQVEGVSDAVKKAAYSKLLALCKEHGIHVSDEDADRMRIAAALFAVLD